MEPKECKAIVEFLSVSWSQSIDKPTLTLRTKTYWEYIKDLPYAETKQQVKRLAMAGRKWMPRPGELRMEVLSALSDVELPPSGEEAWSTLQHISTQISSGSTNYEKPHPVLIRVIQQLGKAKALDLKTNSDRDTFFTIYERAREQFMLENFGEELE